MAGGEGSRLLHAIERPNQRLTYKLLGPRSPSSPPLETAVVTLLVHTLLHHRCSHLCLATRSACCSTSDRRGDAYVDLLSATKSPHASCHLAGRDGLMALCPGLTRDRSPLASTRRLHFPKVGCR